MYTFPAFHSHYRDQLQNDLLKLRITKSEETKQLLYRKRMLEANLQELRAAEQALPDQEQLLNPELGQFVSQLDRLKEEANELCQGLSYETSLSNDISACIEQLEQEAGQTRRRIQRHKGQAEVALNQLQLAREAQHSCIERREQYSLRRQAQLAELQHLEKRLAYFTELHQHSEAEVTKLTAELSQLATSNEAKRAILNEALSDQIQQETEKKANQLTLQFAKLIQDEAAARHERDLSIQKEMAQFERFKKAKNELLRAKREEHELASNIAEMKRRNQRFAASQTEIAANLAKLREEAADKFSVLQQQSAENQKLRATLEQQYRNSVYAAKMFEGRPGSQAEQEYPRFLRSRNHF